MMSTGYDILGTVYNRKCLFFHVCHSMFWLFHVTNWIFPLNLCTLSFVGEKSEALLAFSFYSNGMKLLSYSESKSADVIQCLHGIRVISTLWVVLGHTFKQYQKIPIQNMSTVLRVNESSVLNLKVIVIGIFRAFFGTLGIAWNWFKSRHFRSEATIRGLNFRKSHPKLPNWNRSFWPKTPRNESNCDQLSIFLNFSVLSVRFTLS